MEDLIKYREKINQIDNQIVNLLIERIKICLEIGKVKKRNNVPILNMDREKEVITRNSEIAPTEHRNFVSDLYKIIIKYCREIQE